MIFYIHLLQKTAFRIYKKTRVPGDKHDEYISEGRKKTSLLLWPEIDS